MPSMHKKAYSYFKNNSVAVSTNFTMLELSQLDIRLQIVETNIRDTVISQVQNAVFVQ